LQDGVQAEADVDGERFEVAQVVGDAVGKDLPGLVVKLVRGRELGREPLRQAAPRQHGGCRGFFRLLSADCQGIIIFGNPTQVKSRG
jgi:hypothetical protein